LKAKESAIESSRVLGMLKELFPHERVYEAFSEYVANSKMVATEKGNEK
jgi:hypothetical protein